MRSLRARLVGAARRAWTAWRQQTAAWTATWCWATTRSWTSTRQAGRSKWGARGLEDSWRGWQDLAAASNPAHDLAVSTLLALRCSGSAWSFWRAWPSSTAACSSLPSSGRSGRRCEGRESRGPCGSGRSSYSIRHTFPCVSSTTPALLLLACNNHFHQCSACRLITAASVITHIPAGHGPAAAAAASCARQRGASGAQCITTALS